MSQICTIPKTALVHSVLATGNSVRTLAIAAAHPEQLYHLSSCLEKL